MLLHADFAIHCMDTFSFEPQKTNFLCNELIRQSVWSLRKKPRDMLLQRNEDIKHRVPERTRKRMSA